MDYLELLKLIKFFFGIAYTVIVVTVFKIIFVLLVPNEIQQLILSSPLTKLVNKLDEGTLGTFSTLSCYLLLVGILPVLCEIFIRKILKKVKNKYFR